MTTQEYTEPNRYRNRPDFDRALSKYQFECLMEETYSVKPLMDLEMRFMLLGMARLGLRRGEMTHLHIDWIDWDNQQIEIPEYHGCTTGQGDSICAHCKQMARQIADRDEDVDYETALSERWSPKTPKSARTIPFSFSGRIELVFEQFFDEFDHWMYSAQALNRRMNTIADRTDGVDELSAHILRSTAATYHYRRGVDLISLEAFMGWSHAIVNRDYITKTTEDIERAFESSRQ